MGVTFDPLATRDLKTSLLFGSFLRKGEVLAYVGRIHNLKDLKDAELVFSQFRNSKVSAKTRALS